MVTFVTFVTRRLTPARCVCMWCAYINYFNNITREPPKTTPIHRVTNVTNVTNVVHPTNAYFLNRKWALNGFYDSCWRSALERSASRQGDACQKQESAPPLRRYVKRFGRDFLFNLFMRSNRRFPLIRYFPRFTRTPAWRLMMPLKPVLTLMPVPAPGTPLTNSLVMPAYVRSA